MTLWARFAGLGSAAIAVGLLLAGCVSILEPGVSITQTGANGGLVQAVPGGTDPEDMVIGRREHPLIVASYGGVYEDRKAEIMLARIVGRLLTAAQKPNTQFTVTILDSPEVNAFALPGGYIYVTRGILALANDASELAAVLAHEISHVTLRHARARTSRTRTSEIVDQVIIGVLGGNLETDQTANRSRVSLASFSQSQELAADKEGIKVAGKAGFDPHAAARFLSTMGRFAQQMNAEGAADDFLSSHPSTPARIQKAIEIARGSFGAPGIGVRDRGSFLTAIDGLAFGANPAQGAIVGQRFVHPDLGFTFTVPGGYVLQNNKDAVVAVAQSGEAVRFDSAEVPLDMALTDYLASGWVSGLKSETVKRETHHGVAMVSGVAQTDKWAFRVSVLRYEDKVYRFIFAAESDSDAFAKAAQQTISSFRKATRSDISRIRSLAIKIVTAGAGEGADSLARRMPEEAGGAVLFYVLNNLFSGDTLETGAPYKLVVVR